MNSPISSSYMPQAATDAFFNEFSGHPGIDLAKLRAPRLLWLNERLARADAESANLSFSFATYAQWLLDRCAYVIPSDDARAFVLPHETVRGICDRYGGAGIGGNGGSGRAAFVNGYHVKGVGRTPLVSDRADLAHASGGAYFEEALRETIFAEVVAAEFPHGAIGTLAIIDTGIVQAWPTGIPRAERRVLIVRPSFIRPAHFFRARGFSSAARYEGVRDHARIGGMFRSMFAQYEAAEIVESFAATVERLSRQIAHGFIHRLPHGSYTVSNCAVGGALLDFGAMSAVASWANIATTNKYVSFNCAVQPAHALVNDMAYYLGRHVDKRCASRQFVSEHYARANAAFKETIVREMLYLSGVEREIDVDFDAAWNVAAKLVNAYQREKLDCAYVDASPRHAFDFHALWHEAIPDHLIGWRDLIRSVVPRNGWDTARENCHARCRPRRHVCRHALRARIFSTFAGSADGEAASFDAVQKFMIKQLALARRSTFLSSPEYVDSGFFVQAQRTLVIFREKMTGNLVAVEESDPSFRNPQRIAYIDETHIVKDGESRREQGYFGGASSPDEFQNF